MKTVNRLIKGLVIVMLSALLSSCEDRVVAQLEADQVTEDNSDWLKGRPVVIRGVIGSDAGAFYIESVSGPAIEIDLIGNEPIEGCISKYFGVQSQVFGRLERRDRLVEVGFIRSLADDPNVCANPSNEANLLDGWSL